MYEEYGHAMVKSNTDLYHWGRVAQICVSKLTITGWDNGLLPDRRQTIIWIIAEITLISPLELTSMNFKSKSIHFQWRKCISNVVYEMVNILFLPEGHNAYFYRIGMESLAASIKTNRVVMQIIISFKTRT